MLLMNLLARSMLLVGAASLATAAEFRGSQHTWAVIAAGSSGYENYRHQADACHAYQILRRGGVPEAQIILMMQDDVANDTSNPFPGQLFNKKGDNVTDLYAGCKVDYRGSIVTAATFLQVITGDSTGLPAGSKVLRSGPHDRVFMNFVDHGGVGIVAFPNGPVLHASDLAKALGTMRKRRMFHELLFYMEACESGSMFPDLSATSKIFAVTAANAEESSYGYYCPPDDDYVNGKQLGTCLADLFSIAWMEDSDLGQLGSVTIREQVKRVTARTNLSHVSTFGDTSFEGEPMGNFLGLGSAPHLVGSRVVTLDRAAMNVRDIELHAADLAWQAASTQPERTKASHHLQAVLEARATDEAVFDALAQRVCKDAGQECSHLLKHSRAAMQDAGCHKALALAIHETCPRRGAHNPGGWNTFNMQFSQVLVNLCEARRSLQKDLQDLLSLVREECGLAAARGRRLLQQTIAV